MNIPSHKQRSTPDRRLPEVAAVGPEMVHGNGNGNGVRSGELHVVDPVDLFTGLVGALIPTFCDGIRLDLATGDGNTVKVSYGPAANGHEAGNGHKPGIGVLAEQSVTAGRIVIKVRSEPVAGESPITGTITCTWHDQQRPTEVDAVVARLFADRAVAQIRIENLATVLEKQRTRTVNLEHALATNREIGQAIGILMATDRLTSAQAFERLRLASQHAHRKLREIAAEVAETGGLAEPGGPVPDGVTIELVRQPPVRPHADPAGPRHHHRATQRPGPRENGSSPPPSAATE